MVLPDDRIDEDGPLRLLLLEDSDIDAELVETHLAAGRLSFAIERARNRAEFEHLMASPPDLVLADYALPDFDGLAALNYVRKNYPDVPFVFVSGVVGEEFATQALQEGAVDYVTKRNLRRLRTAVARAVTEARERVRRQRAEADLRASEAGSRIALRAARLGGWDLDKKHGLTTWDARTRTIFGIGPDVEIDEALFDAMVHPDDRDRVNQAMNRAMTHWSHSDFGEQFRIMTPTGDMRWIESTGSAIFENGACVRFVGVVRDITDEKRAELALLDRTASLEASVEQKSIERHLLWRNSQDLLVVIGPDGRLRDVTPSWHRLLGQRPEDALGQFLVDIVHPDDIDETRRALETARPQSPIQFENRIRHADGGYRWFSWTALPTETGVIYGNGRHITEEKEAAERMRVMEEALRQSQKMEAIGQLTGGIAHDFNNLLAGIIGSLDVIKRRLAKGRTDDIDRFMDAATTSAQRAASLTQRLLAFSRRQSLDIRAENVARVLGSIEELLRRTLGENVSLTTAYEEPLWPANTDANQLESAILNLAINARDAMPEGGALAIEARNWPARGAPETIAELDGRDHVLVAVSDNGEGMSEEVIAKAFDPFFTTKPIGQGTGLGLSMVYGFVNQVGGHVRIVSEPDKGTRIELYFLRATEQAHEKESAAPRVEHKTNGEIVLVVEDDNAVRMLITEVLSDLGYESIQASDADTALPVITSDQRIDLIVTDFGLPGLNGRQLADIARRHRHEVPILFVTGYAQGAETRAGFLDAGMSMLTKPFSNDELSHRIHAMLNR